MEVRGLELTTLTWGDQGTHFKTIPSDQSYERDKPGSPLRKCSRPRERASRWEHSGCVQEAAGREVPLEWKKPGGGQK